MVLLYSTVCLSTEMDIPALEEKAMQLTNTYNTYHEKQSALEEKINLLAPQITELKGISNRNIYQHRKLDDLLTISVPWRSTCSSK